MRLVVALRPFWDARCYHRLARNLLLRALDQDEGRAPVPLRTAALDAAGYFLAITGELREARQKHEESLGLARERGDSQAAASALWRLGIVALREGRPEEAEALQRKSLEISRNGGRTLNLAGALNNLGTIAFDRGDYRLAESYWRETLDIDRELGSVNGLTMSLFNHARLARQTGEFARADTLLREARATAQRSGHSGNIAFALISLGDLYLDSDYEQSRAFLEEALDIVRRAGYQRYTGIALAHLATLAIRQGHYDEARELLKESLILFNQIAEEDSPNASTSRLRASELALEEGRVGDARAMCERELHGESSKPRRQQWLPLLGWVRLAQGDETGGRAAFDECVTLATESTSAVGWADAHLGLGYLQLMSGATGDAKSRFEAALRAYECSNNQTGIVKALVWIGNVDVAEGQLRHGAWAVLRALRLSEKLGFQKGHVDALRGLEAVASKQRRPLSEFMRLEVNVREGLPVDADAGWAVAQRAERALRAVYRLTAEVVRASEARAGSRRQLVAEYDREIVGIVSYENRGDGLHLQALAVEPSWQRRGIARALVMHLVKLARSVGAARLSLYTVIETGNIPIFERLGFHVVSTQPASGLEAVSTSTLMEAYMEMPIQM